MAKKDSINRYNLIINKLRKHPCNFNQMLDYLKYQSEMQGYNFVISKRTFQRDIEDISSIFNIEIAYDFSRKVYYIELDENPDYNERILEAFDTFNALNVTDRISKHIHFETRKPKGTENLYGIIHAVKNNLKIRFTHYKFWDKTPTERSVEPYGLKEFKNRWYIVAKDDKDNIIKTFALDRISELEITKFHFQPNKQFDIAKHFKYCFGIIAPDNITDEPEEVIISFTPFQGKYIKTLPLHNTQEILEDNDKELRVKLTIHITYDFIMELMAHAEELKIIQPISLKDEMLRKLNKAIQKNN